MVWETHNDVKLGIYVFEAALCVDERQRRHAAVYKLLERVDDGRLFSGSLDVSQRPDL